MKFPEIYAPASLAEIWTLQSELAGKYALAAGGTDLLVESSRLNPDRHLIDLSGVPELKGLARLEGGIIFGALTTMSALAANETIIREASALAQAAGRVGSWQIRNRATIGGNLANASPAADTPPALAALETTVELFSPAGRRTLPVEEIPVGPNQNSLKTGEVLTAFNLPLKDGRISAFKKLGSRSEVSIARLNLAAAVTAEQGQLSEARVFLGTLGLALRRSPAAEAVLIQEGFKQGGEPFAEALMETINRAIPGRATLPYKTSAVRALAEDLLDDLQGKLQERAGK